MVGLKTDYHLLDPSEQRKYLKMMIKDNEGDQTSEIFKRLVKKEMDAKKLKGQVSMPYSKIIQTIDSFKNRCILPYSQDPDS